VKRKFSLTFNEASTEVGILGAAEKKKRGEVEALS
jgi:hypothetical protein